MARNFVASSSQYLSGTIAAVAAPYSMWVWARPGAAGMGTNRVIMALSQAGSGDGKSRRFVLLSTDKVLYQDHDGTNAGTIITSGAVSSGTLYGIGASSSGVASRILYALGETITDTTSITVTGINLMSFGRREAFADQYYDGDIAEAALWNIDLTATEMAMLNLGISPLLVRPSSLVSYWNLYGTYSPERDRMVANASLTLTNSPVQAVHPRILNAWGQSARREPGPTTPVTQMGWRGSFPDLLLDTSVEMVESGFTPRSPQDPFDPTPN